MKLIWAVLLATISAVSSVAGAAAKDSAGELAQLLRGMESLQGHFKQALLNKEGKVMQTSGGRFVIKRPGFFYWESEAPYEQKVIGNREKLWIYDPDLEQVTVRNQNGGEPDSPARILSGDFGDLHERFVVETESAKNEKRFTLTPREGADNLSFSNITFAFDKKKLTALAFTDQMGQQTQLLLQNTTVNKPVDMALFEFEPPAGTDVIIDD